jgi:peptidyl-prolyl cis-trans isomerase C
MPRLLNASWVFVALLVAAGCHKSEPAVGSANGKPITQAQWDAYLKFKPVPGDDAAHKARVLDDYVTNVGLASVIEADKLLDPQRVQTEVDEVKKQVLITRYFEKFLQEKVTTKAVQDYYDSHPTEFEEQSAHIAQILFRFTPRMTEDERKTQLKAAQEAYAQLRAGKDFAALASTISEDRASNRNGGDLGWLRPGAVDPTFSKHAFALNAGDIAQPFQTPFGFHVIKALEAPKMQKRPLATVSTSIRNQLRAEAKAAETERLLAKAAIEIDGKPRAVAKEAVESDTRRADRK